MTTGQRTVHLLDIGGRGGVFQHTLTIANQLAASGCSVTLHTARDCEHQPDEGVNLCACVVWGRSGPRWWRRLKTLTSLVARTAPHIGRLARKADVLHVHGATPLNLLFTVPAKGRWGTFVFSPHNTFDRHGSKLSAKALMVSARVSDRVVVYSTRDAERIAKWEAEVVVMPLVQFVVNAPSNDVTLWRRRLHALEGEKLVALVGQVRKDKNPSLFVEAMSYLPGVKGAIVGEDHGAMKAAARRNQELDAGVVLIDEYLSMSDFSALVSAADCIVAPYSVASQSGVLAVARQMGVATVSSAEGGLSEMADVTVSDLTAQALAAGIDRALALSPRAPTSDDGTAYLHLYSLDRAELA